MCSGHFPEEATLEWRPMRRGAPQKDLGKEKTARAALGEATEKSDRIHICWTFVLPTCLRIPLRAILTSVAPGSRAGAS